MVKRTTTEKEQQKLWEKAHKCAMGEYLKARGEGSLGNEPEEVGIGEKNVGPLIDGEGSTPLPFSEIEFDSAKGNEWATCITQYAICDTSVSLLPCGRTAWFTIGQFADDEIVRHLLHCTLFSTRNIGFLMNEWTDGWMDTNVVGNNWNCTRHHGTVVLRSIDTLILKFYKISTVQPDAQLNSILRNVTL